LRQMCVCCMLKGVEADVDTLYAHMC
jgi:hypothetical protein